MTKQHTLASFCMLTSLIISSQAFALSPAYDKSKNPAGKDNKVVVNVNNTLPDCFILNGFKACKGKTDILPPVISSKLIGKK